MCKFCTNPYGENEEEKIEDLDVDYYLTCPDCGLIPVLKFDYDINLDPILNYDCLCLNSETNKISYIYHQLRNNLNDIENLNKNIFECNCNENLLILIIKILILLVFVLIVIKIFVMNVKKFI